MPMWQLVCEGVCWDIFEFLGYLQRVWGPFLAACALKYIWPKRGMAGWVPGATCSFWLHFEISIIILSILKTGWQVQMFACRRGLARVENSFGKESGVNLFRMQLCWLGLSSYFRISAPQLATHDKSSQTVDHSSLSYVVLPSIFPSTVYPLAWCPPMFIALHLPLLNGRALATSLFCQALSAEHTCLVFSCPPADLYVICLQ